jgi:fluoroacetyl-CoA thioesterase
MAGADNDHVKMFVELHIGRHIELLHENALLIVTTFQEGQAKALTRERDVSSWIYKVLGLQSNGQVWSVTSSMARDIPIGVRGEAVETVELKHTLAARNPQLPPVYSTPDMIRLMETAGFLALQPFCDEAEITVGTSIHVLHLAATGIGMQIRAEAELEEFDGRFYRMRVSAHDGTREIGRGTIGRAVVHVPSFVARMRQKAGG